VEFSTERLPLAATDGGDVAALVITTSSRNARLAVVEIVTVEFGNPPEKETVFVSNVPDITLVYVTVSGLKPVAVTVMLPSTMVQPLSLKLTVKAPPPELRSSVFVVIEPTLSDTPIFTAPPAW
jgi:hypothetical protein